MRRKNSVADLRRKRRARKKARAEAETARVEADAARVDAGLALKRAADAESKLKSLRRYTEKTETSTRARC
jgi:hypothetical protein